MVQAKTPNFLSYSPLDICGCCRCGGAWWCIPLESKNMCMSVSCVAVTLTERDAQTQTNMDRPLR